MYLVVYCAPTLWWKVYSLNQAAVAFLRPLSPQTSPCIPCCHGQPDPGPTFVPHFTTPAPTHHSEQCLSRLALIAHIPSIFMVPSNVPSYSCCLLPTDATRGSFQHECFNPSSCLSLLRTTLSLRLSSMCHFCDSCLLSTDGARGPFDPYIYLSLVIDIIYNHLMHWPSQFVFYQFQYQYKQGYT